MSTAVCVQYWLIELDETVQIRTHPLRVQYRCTWCSSSPLRFAGSHNTVNNHVATNVCTTTMHKRRESTSPLYERSFGFRCTCTRYVHNAVRG
jgi:hypothetical protein